jgi:hypothetical protein
MYGSVGGHGISGVNQGAGSGHIPKIRPEPVLFPGIVFIPLKFTQEVRVFITCYTEETLQQTKDYQVYS